MNPSIMVSQEPISRIVGRWLLENGYEPASSAGMARAVQEIGSESIGILQQDPDAESYSPPFGILTSRRPKRNFLGTIWFKDTKEHWVFEVYGSKYLVQAEILADQMSQQFGVIVTPRLIRKAPRTENHNQEHND